MEETTFIYGLTDPDTGVIRYIGKSNDPQVRYLSHLADARSIESIKQYACHFSLKELWLSDLMMIQGKTPNLVILEKCTADCWRQREREWIQFYLAQGVNLVNDMGTGRPRVMRLGKASINWPKWFLDEFAIAEYIL